MNNTSAADVSIHAVSPVSMVGAGAAQARAAPLVLQVPALRGRSLWLALTQCCWSHAQSKEQHQGDGFSSVHINLLREGSLELRKF